MSNANNNRQSQASFCFWKGKAGFCFWDRDGKQQKRPTVDLKLSDLTKTVRL